MIYFKNDYQCGCIPEIMEALSTTNLDATPGYGTDEYCAKAAELIKEKCCCPDADVHFLVGGTQTNATVISSILRPFQGAVCAHTGHIAVHETGAIEHSGHKVLAVPSKDGKLDAGDLEAFLGAHFNQESPEHEVQPGLVYVSYSTELGTLYSHAEMLELKKVCRKYKLPLFIDGARLGYGLASSESDMTLKDIASLADVFYIGGTKQGALFGEAVVICNPALKKDFRYCIKMNGGLLAKGRLLGIQFMTLFAGNLYMDYAAHANAMAKRLSEAFKAAGYRMLVDSCTNQIFPVLPTAVSDALSSEFVFEKWCDVEPGYAAWRFCTSWSTKPEAVDALIAKLQA